MNSICKKIICINEHFIMIEGRRNEKKRLDIYRAGSCYISGTKACKRDDSFFLWSQEICIYRAALARGAHWANATGECQWSIGRVCCRKLPVYDRYFDESLCLCTPHLLSAINACSPFSAVFLDRRKKLIDVNCVFAN